MMSVSHVFRGFFNRGKEQDRGRRRILLIELPPEETEAFDAQLGGAHRSQNIPVAFVIGEAADVLSTIRGELSLAPPPTGCAAPEPPPPGPSPAFTIDLARRVEAVAELTTQRVLADCGMRTWTANDRRCLGAALDELNETARAVAQEAAR